MAELHLSNHGRHVLALAVSNGGRVELVGRRAARGKIGVYDRLGRFHAVNKNTISSLCRRELLTRLDVGNAGVFVYELTARGRELGTAHLDGKRA